MQKVAFSASTFINFRNDIVESRRDARFSKSRAK